MFEHIQKRISKNNENKIRLDSFGLWYKPSAKNSFRINLSHKGKTEFELHINLWSKVKAKHDFINNTFNNTFLDVGIKVKNYKEISELIFLCPFKFDINNIQDLSSKMTRKENVDLIFNNNCELRSKDRYWIIENAISNDYVEKLLVFPFYQAVEDIIAIEDVIENESSKLIIRFDSFKQYIESLGNDDRKKCDDNLDKVKDIYIRFRINSPELERKIFRDFEPKNRLLLSGFTSIQIIDFKMNSKRNIDDKILARSVRNDEKIVAFTRIHFMLVVPSASDVIFIGENTSACRHLEKNRWDDYLDRSKVNDLIVYHWKKIVSSNRDCKEDNKPIEEYNQLAKIKHLKITLMTIFKYLVVGAAISVLTSAIFQYYFKK